MAGYLKIEGLYFKYNNINILEDIHLEFNSGDFVGILGPNGCGKTTLLNNINRWLKPSKGSIYLDDMDLTRMSPKKLARHVATVTQDVTMDINFSVLEVVLMGRNPYLKNFEVETEKDVEIAKAAMEFADIWHLRDKPVNQLSGGERQRVLIARALTQQPRILLLDEPTSHLDINYQWEILELLKKMVAEKKLIVIIVMHDLNLASMFCDKIILLKDHKIYKMGYTRDVLTEQNIKDLFNINVRVSLHKETQRPMISFLGNPKQIDRPRMFNKIHVICGGGEGEELLHYLKNRGYEISVGVLNRGDTDWKTAKLLDLTIIEEKPFSYISEEKVEENREHIKMADAVVMADIPFGYGNLGNITCLDETIGKKPIYLVEEKPLNHRDYTEGQALKKYCEIRKHAKIMKSYAELKNVL